MQKKFGLIGFGYAGKTFHAPLIAATPGAVLAMIATSQAEEATLHYPGAVIVPDAAALIADPQIDVVVLATPNASHYPLALAALEAGKHVVVDKPFTLTVAEAEDLAQKAVAAGKVLSVFHNRRWDADFMALKTLLASGCLGDVVQFENQFNRYRPEVKDRWRENDLPGSGLWFDLGPHLIDQTLQLFGKPEAVFADLQKRRAGAQAVDDFHVLLRYPGLRVTLAGSCLVSGGSPRFLVHGTLASFEKHGLDVQELQLKAGLLPGDAGFGIDPVAGQLHTSRQDQIESAAVGMPRGHYLAYYQGICAALDGAANPVTPEEGILIMQILQAAEQSAVSGCWHTL